jgi:membrane protein implicated in regulation of membrane protease activity
MRNEPHLAAELIRAVAIVAGLVGLAVTPEQVDAVVLVATAVVSLVATLAARRRSVGPVTHAAELRGAYRLGQRVGKAQR